MAVGICLAQGAAYGLQAQGFGQTSYGGGGYRGNVAAPGLGGQIGVPGLPGTLPGAQLGLGSGLGLNTSGFPAAYGGLAQVGSQEWVRAPGLRECSNCAQAQCQTSCSRGCRALTSMVASTSQCSSYGCGHVRLLGPSVRVVPTFKCTTG